MEFQEFPPDSDLENRLAIWSFGGYLPTAIFYTAAIDSFVVLAEARKRYRHFSSTFLLGHLSPCQVRRRHL